VTPLKEALTALADVLAKARRRKSYSTGSALAGWWLKRRLRAVIERAAPARASNRLPGVDC
jgi:hypothetical protein